ncbi:MAG: phosphoadenylyl-sulfate reductase [Bacteroidetes bacterium]|nr:phosphoadenylyl-sulfate reductase [Bacteroidota bacterium]
MIEELNKRFKDKPVTEILDFFLNEYKGKIAFASSLGAEDQILTHFITSIDPKARIFTLDTGRLFQETYDLIDRTNSRYKIGMEVYFPDAQKVEQMVHEKGLNLFYESVQNRKLCCHIRKVESLRRALTGMNVWITGLRREQSQNRTRMALVEADESHAGILKLNPMIDWTQEMVWDFIKHHNVPYNKLHDQGFPSIGCLPCTRAVEPGEDFRAGRWWWEMEGKKECGLHE